MTRAGARDVLAALFPIRELVLGAEHPETLTTRHTMRTGCERRSADAQCFADKCGI